MKRFTLYGSPQSLPTYKVALMLRRLATLHEMLIALGELMAE